LCKQGGAVEVEVSTAGVWALVAALVLATVFGVVRRRRAGRVRATGDTSVRLSAEQLRTDALGERATLVQFSSAFCRPCVAARHVLADAAAKVPGVRHVEVDAESNLELVRALRVASTPTTLLLDSDGVERRRATGVPRKPELLAALADVVD
jgi:thiol-disulfide isomerase/thioredoxin